MSSKREAPARRGNRRRAEGAARGGVRRPADVPQPGRARARGGKPAADARAPRPRTTAIGRPAPAKSAGQAKARAKARKAKAPKVVRVPLRERLINRLASIDLRPRTLLARVPFVVLVIGALGVGLGVTLWLSTDAAERSYQLSSAREHNRLLLQQKEALEREVLQAESAPALAEAARGLGMIPSRDTAHLVQDPSGAWVVVGNPTPAQGAALPPLNNRLPDDVPAPVAVAPVNPVEVPVRVTPGLGVPPAAPGVPVAPGALAVPGGLSAPDQPATAGAPPLPGDVPAAGPSLPVAVPSEPVPGVALLPGPPSQLAVPQQLAAPQQPVVPAVPVVPVAPGSPIVPIVPGAAG